nr:urease accessory protein UreD [Arthrobacter sp. zg-Y179]
MSFGPGTSAHVTTQTQTRVYRMDHDYASALMNITVEEGARVEYLPEPVVPFAASRYYQQTSVVIDESATLMLSDTMYAGRLARGERHAYDVYASDLEVRRPDGGLVALDRVRLSPGAGADGAVSGVGGLGVLANHDVLAMLYVFTPLVPAAQLADTLHRSGPALVGSGCGWNRGDGGDDGDHARFFSSHLHLAVYPHHLGVPGDRPLHSGSQTHVSGTFRALRPPRGRRRPPPPRARA